MLRNPLIRMLVTQQNQHPSVARVILVGRTSSLSSCRRTLVRRRWLSQNVSTAESSISSTTNWQDWLIPGPLYSSAWERPEDEDAWLQVLDHKPLDYQSRHLIQLLQEFYKSGGRPRTFDIATTKRCNAVLQELANNALTSGVLHRADAILKTMHLFDEAANRHTQSTLETVHTSTRVVMHLPRADIETYNTIFIILASISSGTRYYPERALEICHYMQNQYQTYGEIALKPNALHYNSVLNAWLKCTCPIVWSTKPVHAAKVFLQEMTTETRDTSSFVSIFKICAHTQYYDRANKTQQPQEQQQQQQSPDSVQRARDVGAQVAIKVWETVMDDCKLDLSPHVYTHFLQAIRSLPAELPMRAQYFKACFQHAIHRGKVNVFLINEFIVHCKSAAVFNEFLGKYQQKTRGMNPTKAAKFYFEHCIPKEWRVNIKESRTTSR